MKEPKIDLRHADCMEMMREFPDKHFELAIVDPPYGINVSKMAYTQEDGLLCLQKNGSRLAVKKTKYQHKNWDAETPKKDYFIELFRVSKNQVIWGVNYLPILLNGGRIVWNKLNGNNSFSDAEIAFCSKHERVRVFDFMWSGMCQGLSAENGRTQQGNKKLNEKRIHPTQKPVALYKWLLKNYAKEGDRILDTHGGSMSIAIACWDMGFDLTLSELDADYYAAGVERFEAHRKKYASAEIEPVTKEGQVKLF